jgi:xanthine dehydrogenase small subunit
MATRGKIRFLLGDEPVTVSGLDPNTTLLDYLRANGRPGTKEGCAEGDCGACTVVLADAQDGGLRYRSVNACVQLLATVDGKQVVTVEDLSTPGADLHPVQAALLEENATQCGFCTPGFVMSLFALHQAGERPDRAGLVDALAGNLCRCTGYSPIVEAGLRALEEGRKASDRKIAKTLSGWHGDGSRLAYDAGGRRFDVPRDRAELAALLAQEPEATLVAGLSDVGLWITKQHRRLERIVYLGEVAELGGIREEDGLLEIGAAVTLGEALPVVAGHWPDLGVLLRRFGSPQIRNVATLGGNIANGSPIGDLPPPLIALSARLVLGHKDGAREIALEDFFIDYGRQDLRPGEFVEAVRIPLPSPEERFACYKLSKRFDQDISAVCGAFHLRLDEGGAIEAARIAYGGMAATPKRASLAEAALHGRPWDEPAVQDAMAALESDVTPIDDHRASAAYRMLAARNLLYKFYLESTDTATVTRLPGLGIAHHG